MSVRAFQHNSYTGEWIVNRPAHAQLAVHATVIFRACGQEYARDEFVDLQVAVVFAQAGVEVSERDTASSVGTRDFKLCFQTEQGRGSIPRKRCPALSSAGGNVAKIAVFLDAESTTLAPG